MLQLAIYDAPSGNLFLDCTGRTGDLKFATGEHGFESLRANIRMSLAEAFQLYDRPGLPHVEVNCDGQRIWEGRLEDVAITDEGAAITALGYWRAMSDVPYAALWSECGFAKWRAMNATDGTDHFEQRYEMDANNQLYIAPRKSELFGNTGVDKTAAFIYRLSYGEERGLCALSFDWEVAAPLNSPGYWRLMVTSHNEDLSLSQTLLSIPANNQTLSGGQGIAFVPKPVLIVSLRYEGADWIYTGETGATYGKITNLRVKTTASATVDASEIAAELVKFVNSVNPAQISASAAQIQSPGLDLSDEAYKDEYPADILTRLAGLGDNQTPPRKWEVGVWEGRLVHFRPRCSAGRAWYVNAASLELERSLDQLRNSAYTVYEAASMGTIRSMIGNDPISIRRFGLTRRAAVQARTSDGTPAGPQRDAFLIDHATPPARAKIVIPALYDATGGRWPLWSARAGDTVTLRSLPPALSTDVDRIRSFRISRTEYKADDDTLTIEPEQPLPTLESVLARWAEGIG